jgi:hypothetical protein
MDYTSPERVKAHLHIAESTDDALLATLVTAASRAIDRKCTQSTAPEAENYFALETVSEELLRAQVDGSGVLKCWPHKPTLASVSSLTYRRTPLEIWTTVATDRIMTVGAQVQAWPTATVHPDRYYVRLSYTGGYATAVEQLPADLVEAATVLASRYYREAETGLNDALGIAEIGQMVYTKALPVRVVDMLQPFIRKVPW